ncbi:hypothetical protein CWO91_35520 [Bradyrhizobium genosp. SA-3]|uniref:amidase domain-containing protein n=1 Tax=Bradyrhizobium genosp. SA-3 TaxID=508868 RepID=UPI00102A48F3|nr:amidase domain-containing protein [Bradyrhizobium genosp. SA-3]RZM99581.1 hypothetical protein CWO91_35520 [Bradyrhizobium genosp. SA-3]
MASNIRNVDRLAATAVEEALSALRNKAPLRDGTFAKSDALFKWIERNLSVSNRAKLKSIDFEPTRRRIRSTKDNFLVELSGIQRESYEAYETVGAVTYAVELHIDGANVRVVSFEVHLIDTTSEVESSDLTEGPLTLPFDTNWTWNGDRAAKYSADYAMNPNSAYRTYDVDCTNFASQCLTAGGKTEIGSVIDRKNDDVWFYGTFEATTSYTWAAAQNLFQHLTNYTDTTTEADHLSLRPGDLIIMEPKPGHAWHTMVVTERTDDDALMSYHTKNTLRRSFNQILANSIGAKQFWYLKIGTGYKASAA